MAAKVRVTELGYLGINTNNLDKWRSFFTDAAGMQLADKADDGTLYVRMDERHHRFLVHKSEEEDVAYLGWQVATEADLDTTPPNWRRPISRSRRAHARRSRRGTY